MQVYGNSLIRKYLVGKPCKFGFDFVRTSRSQSYEYSFVIKRRQEMDIAEIINYRLSKDIGIPQTRIS